MIAPFGVEVAFFIGSVAVAVFAAVVAMEMKRNPLGWAIVGFFGTLIVASGVHALL